MVRTLRSLLVAAALLTGAAVTTVALPAGSASAASCADASGVTVVVDPQQLGGGVHEVCDSSGAAKTAAAIFEDSGFHQSYTSTGMVCQINAQPSGDVCRHDPQATAYWSLWWSDGTSGWAYASLGAGSLKIPAGGSVAWVWQGQSTKHVPSVAPAKKVQAAPVAAPAPTRIAKPKLEHRPAKASPAPHVTAAASAAPSATGATAATDSPSRSATASASAAAQPKKAKHTASATGSTSEAAASGPSATTSADSAVISADSVGSSTNSGLPGWIAPAVIAVLAVVAGGIALARRRKV